jgi:hypothetical protein
MGQKRVSSRFEVRDATDTLYTNIPLFPTCCVWQVAYVVMWGVFLVLSHTSAWALATGDRVQANATLNVRPSAGSSTSLGTQSTGAQGTITGGPQTASFQGSSYVWWQVNWDSGPDGWSVAGGLTQVVSPPGSFTLSGTAYCNTSPPTAPAVQLTWTTASGATSYDVYRNGTLYSSGNPFTSFDNTANVTAGQSYTYYVVARNATGTSQSNTITVTVSSTVCGTPPGSFTLSGTAYCNTSPPTAPAVQLTWTTASGATSYDVYRNGTLYFSGNPFTHFDNNINVAAGQSYTYYVVARNATGTSQSNTITVAVSSTVCESFSQPAISRLNPNPVPGSNHSQPFTINGSNFVQGATVTLRDLRTREVFPNRPISFLSSSEIVINPNFTVAEATWSVEVINPGGASSGQVQFQVVAPDLIVENVTFNSGSVVAGNSITIGFRIRNIGSGAAIATQARLRLSLDTILTLNDLLLSPLDVNIPPLGVGPSAFYDFNGTVTVPNTTPQGRYYVGVFADWDNRANQSKVTNDTGLSPPQNPLSVIAPSAQPPAIISHPQSQTINPGDPVSLSVMVQSNEPVTYQWKHNGNRIRGAEKSTLSFSASIADQAGDYSVDVLSAFGPLTSNSARIAHSTPPIIEHPPLPPPETGRLHCASQVLTTCTDQIDQQILTTCTDQLVNPNLPTIVLTHGWQPTGQYQSTALPPDFKVMFDAIVERLYCQHVPANVIAFSWSGAFTSHSPLVDLLFGGPQSILFAAHQSYGNTDDAGHYLRRDLNRLLPNYTYCISRRNFRGGRHLRVR